MCPCISLAASETPAVQEEEGLACRRQDISSRWACRRCAHFLQLFPAVSCSERSAGVEQAPPSVIIFPSPATQPPSADNRTSPPRPFSLHSHRQLRPFVIPNLLSFFFFYLLYDFHIFLLSICYPISLPDLSFYFASFHFFSRALPFFFFNQTQGSVTLRPFVEAAADLGSLERLRTPTAAFADRFLSYEQLCRILSQREA